MDLTEPQQGERFTKMGVLPKYAVDGLVETFSLVRRGRFAYLTKDVAKATGKQPDLRNAGSRARRRLRMIAPDCAAVSRSAV